MEQMTSRMLGLEPLTDLRVLGKDRKNMRAEE